MRPFFQRWVEMISAGTLLMEKSPLQVVLSLYMVWRSLIKVYIDLKDRSHKAMLPPTSNRICPPLLHSIQAKQTLRDNSRSWGKKQKNSKNFTLTLEATVFCFFFNPGSSLLLLLFRSTQHYTTRRVKTLLSLSASLMLKTLTTTCI